MTDRSVPYHVVECPECSRAHDYSLRIITRSRKGATTQATAPAVLLFGGKDSPAPDSQTWDVTLVCPTKNSSFVSTIEVPLPVAEKIISVEQAREEALETDWRSSELAEWIKGSIASQRDFCRTMLSTAILAIPVYFAVLKYLGVEHVPGGRQVLSVVPPIFLFAAAVAFSWPLRPVGRKIRNIEDFAAFRQRRLEKIDFGINVGMGLFASALLLAVVVWLVLLFF
jgi:hypothetical protein